MQSHAYPSRLYYRLLRVLSGVLPTDLTRIVFEYAQPVCHACDKAVSMYIAIRVESWEQRRYYCSPQCLVSQLEWDTHVVCVCDFCKRNRAHNPSSDG